MNVHVEEDTSVAPIGVMPELLAIWHPDDPDRFRGETDGRRARWLKGHDNWTAEDHREEQAEMDRRYGGRFFMLGAKVSVIATGEIGHVTLRTEPFAGRVSYLLHEIPGRWFQPLDLEAVVDCGAVRS